MWRRGRGQRDDGEAEEKETDPGWRGRTERSYKVSSSFFVQVLPRHVPTMWPEVWDDSLLQKSPVPTSLPRWAL
jgi:hypothetical protein